MHAAHAIATFLSEHFAWVRGRRYDWIGHDTVGGVYISPKSAQHVGGSHDSWPLGKSCNSFDLVRQFMFDPQMQEDRSVDVFKRPSYMKMLAFIRTLPDPELQALNPMSTMARHLPSISGALVDAELERLGLVDVSGGADRGDGDGDGDGGGAETQPEGLKLHDFKHMLKGRAATWVAKNLVQTPSIGAIYGAPGAGKSFLVLDLCLAIARGLSTFGLQDKPTRITQGGVIYIAAEGGAGIHQRLQAYAQAHDLSEGDIAAFSPYFKVLTAARSQMTKPVKLVVFDTLSSVSGAIDENSFEVMRLIDSAKAVAHALQYASYYVHHSGKDATRGLRGFSGLNGALDTIINVTRDKDTGLACAHVEKQKDGFDGANYFFELDHVLLGVDADDDTYGSLVVRHLQGTDDQGVGRVRPSVSRTGLKKGGGGGGEGGDGDEAAGGGVRLRPLQQELYDLLCAEPEPISPEDLLVRHREWVATAKPDVRWHRINTTKSIQSLVDKAALLDIEVDKLGGRPDIYGARRVTLFVIQRDDL